MANDGYYHPATEPELVELVKWAAATDRQLRVRGSTHTFPPRAIFTDSDPGTSARDINIMLDRYRRIRWVDEAKRIVEVEAGCNLSVNPYDPTHTSTVENGLLFQLQKRGWALSDLGGITHQTVGGFLSTGSSGGSLTYGLDENIIGLRIIDGKGEIHELSRESEPDLFLAAGVSMGLLGVISRATFRCIPTFNIEGSEATTTEADCEIDLFGPGTAQRPSLEKFLRDTEYTRLMWWPQANLQRVVVWKAHRVAPTPDFQPKPYEEIGADPEVSEVLAGLLLSILGNLDDLGQLSGKIEPIFSQLDNSLLESLRKLKLSPEVAEALSAMVSALIEFGVDGLVKLPGVDLLAQLLKKNLAEVLPAIFKPFVPLDSDRKPKGPQQFRDYWWTGLPMDNGIDDRLLPTFFTEIWIPVAKTQKVMQALRDFFEKGGLAATGTYSFEIYGTKASPFWMSPSSDGEPVVRVDVFWFGYNAGDPATVLYPQFWELLKPFGFKLHWGKFLPYDPPPAKKWAKYFAQQFKHWGDFLEFRAKLDPKNVFLTAYWREHLGLEEAQPLREDSGVIPAPDPFVTEAWGSAERAITLYSWAILAAVVYGILAAHVPFLIDHPWTTCSDSLACVLTFHFLEVPVILYLTGFAIYGLKGLRKHVNGYSALLGFTLTVLAVFALFEVTLILESIRRSAPDWEIGALYSIASILMLGLGLGIYVRLKLTAALKSP